MRLLIIFMLLGHFFAHAGDFEEFRKSPGNQLQKWTGFKRKVPRDKPRLLRQSAERRREAYITYYQELAKKMAVEREAALNLAVDVSLVRVSLRAAENNCKVVSTLADSDRCLTYLRVILDKVTKLYIQIYALATAADRDVGQAAEKAAADLDLFEKSVWQTFDKWLENKYAIRRELDKRDANAAAKTGRDKALCVSTPLVLQKDFILLEKELNRARAESEPFAVASSLEKCASMKSVITVAEKSCAIDLGAFTNKVESYRAKFDAIVSSGEFNKWYQERCKKVNEETDAGFDCAAQPNSTILFSLQQLSKNKGRR